MPYVSVNMFLRIEFELNVILMVIPKIVSNPCLDVIKYNKMIKLIDRPMCVMHNCYNRCHGNAVKGYSALRFELLTTKPL
jgi:hypothetical protein